MIRLGKEFTTVAITLQQSHTCIYQLYTVCLCLYSIHNIHIIIYLHEHAANEFVYYSYNLYIHCLPDVLPQRHYTRHILQTIYRTIPWEHFRSHCHNILYYNNMYMYTSIYALTVIFFHEIHKYRTCNWCCIQCIFIFFFSSNIYFKNNVYIYIPIYRYPLRPPLVMCVYYIVNHLYNILVAKYYCGRYFYIIICSYHN